MGFTHKMQTWQPNCLLSLLSWIIFQAFQYVSLWHHDHHYNKSINVCWRLLFRYYVDLLMVLFVPIPPKGKTCKCLGFSCSFATNLLIVLPHGVIIRCYNCLKYYILFASCDYEICWRVCWNVFVSCLDFGGAFWLFWKSEFELLFLIN